jgi:endonuclease/exonuclease/phosphatase family metal-dependent hydrolase
MKVLTWNILASEWIKKSYYPGVDAEIIFDKKARFSRIGKILTEIDADIMMLQEVMPQEYLKLVDLFGKKFVVSELKPIVWQYNKNSESGNVTFLRRSLFPKHTISHYPLEYGVYTQCMYKNQPCDIFNIHLDDQSASKRYDQLENLHSIARNKKCNIIIAGDFNHQYRKNGRLYNMPGFKTHNQCPTYYIERKMNIDNILTKGFQKAPLSTCSWYPTRVEDGFKEYGSDHLPVLVDVDVYE